MCGHFQLIDSCVYPSNFRDWDVLHSNFMVRGVFNSILEIEVWSFPILGNEVCSLHVLGIDVWSYTILGIELCSFIILEIEVLPIPILEIEMYSYTILGIEV